MSVRVVAASLATLLLWQAPAQSQTFLQFGVRPSYRLPFDMPRGPSRRDPDLEWQQPQSSFRTLCVRMCDGFYFPISFSTPSGRLGLDADKCHASCGEDARLFYHPNPGGSIDTMTDLSGIAYSALPNAFRYRTSLVSGCQCKPQPWSVSELQRHQSYAAAESKLPPPRPGVTTIARLELPPEPERPPAVTPEVGSTGIDPSLRPLTRWAVRLSVTAAPPAPAAVHSPQPVDQDDLRRATPVVAVPPADKPGTFKRSGVYGRVRSW